MNFLFQFIPLVSVFCWFSAPSFVNGAVSQGEEGPYLASFNKIMEASYSQVDDLSNKNLNKPPQDLLNQCKNRGFVNPTREVTVNSGGSVSAFFVQSQCGTDTICIIPDGVTLKIDGNLNVGALIVRGVLEWTISTQSSSDQFLCGGYVVVENSGSFEMDLNSSTSNKKGWIYIKNNGAVHPELRSRSFGTSKQRYSSDNPTMEIRGRELSRTWSLLSEPLYPGMNTMKLLHDPAQMGWKVGDRLGISPTESTARGWGQDVRIVDIQNDGTITLNENINNYHRADFEIGNDAVANAPPALLSAEIVNLSRNIIITGDDFEEVQCDPNLPEAVGGEQTSVLGCRCATFRNKCHVGLHTMQKFGGVTKIENIRVEKCGQRGIEGKYCMHFHKMEDCPDCLFKGNAIENSQQRGIIIHGTHNTRVEDNVLYNVRGANVYLEDGNEMWNTLAYNVAICPFPFSDNVYHGCTIPGTSNRLADTSDNQSGFFSRAGTNNYIGNRAANHFNGMFLAEGSIGRGEAFNKVCESASRLGRMDGNTWHGNGRFGTYTLGFNYPKETDQSAATNGYNTDKALCDPFDSNGETRGLPGVFVNHVDYGNAFVGHYSAGDLQHYGHHSTDNNNLMYWKETKTFENGCGAHIVNGYYSKGNMLLPDQATFIFENTVIGDDTKLEANHHCNVGTTGVLCMPTYILHKVKWNNKNKNRKWVVFQSKSFQPHNADQNHGGIFTLSPVDAATVLAGGTVEGSLFPQGYISLVSDKFPYLLGLPNNLCINTSVEYGDLYDNGIMCKTELRALKIYTRGLYSGSAPQLKVDIWYNTGGISGQTGSPDSSQYVGFHQVGSDGSSKKQGYSVPVIPGRDHSYRISLTNGNLPNDWVLEFSDPVIGNRWSEDELFLSVAGRDCGNNGLISSQHDRKFIWGGNLFSGYLDDKAWFNHGACVGSGQQPPNESPIDCSLLEDTNNSNRNLLDGNTEQQEFAGVIEATQCPDKCQGGCNSNSYCDCGSETCQCKAGFTGFNCEIDLCADAACGEHGSCSARYLGGEMPVTDKQCVCEGTWLGERCDRNPCVEMGIDCSGNGKCVAVGETEATCECEDGYFGALCEERSPCEGFCEKGSFPYFGCQSDIPNKVALGCFESGGCHYLDEGEEYPYGGFCTYKTYGNVILSPDNFTPTPPVVPAPIATPVAAPVQAPTLSRCECDKCTEEVWNTLANEYSCGDRISFLKDSDEETLINVGITTGPYDEAGACRFVSDEFPTICTCTCDNENNSPPITASPTHAPIEAPPPPPPPTCSDLDTKTQCNSSVGCSWTNNACSDALSTPKSVEPSSSPTALPSFAPTSSPTSIPTPSPTSSPSKNPAVVVIINENDFHCGCSDCTDAVWDVKVDGYTCGFRIQWLQTLQATIVGGPYDETTSCRQVSEEFPEECGRFCHPEKCPSVSLNRNLRGGKSA